MTGQAERAIDLGNRVNGHPEAVEAALSDLEAILRSPDDPHVLVLAIEALGHAWDPRAASLLLSLVDRNHPDGAVRLALARALPGGAGEQREPDAAIAVLVHLSTDDLAQVRDWACFGLGQLEADSPAVRAALAARLGDEDRDTRAEALMALADLADPRALPACLDMLADESGSIGLLTLKAAANLASPLLLPTLRCLQQGWAADDPDEHTMALADALRRCGAGVEQID